jgi:hypothetical protein
VPETFSPLTWINDTTPAINAPNLNRLEQGVEVLDDRIATLELGVVTPVVVPYATSVTLNATQGALFRCVATGDLTLDDIVGGVDGQTIVFEAQASGADRVLHFTGSTESINVAVGQWWVGQFRYVAGSSTWLLDDSSGGGGSGGSGNDLNILAPQNVPYAATITPNAATGALFRVTAVGDVTLADPINGTDGQAVVIEVLASGGSRTVSFAAGYPSVTIPAGNRWSGTLRYDSSVNGWLLATSSNSVSSVTSVNGFTGAVVLGADNISDGSTKVLMTPAERTKLTGVATGATAYTSENARDDIAAALTPGANITITPNDAGDTITIAATGSTGYATVQDEGTARTARGVLNFVGSGVTVTDDAAGSRTLVTIPGSTGGSTQEQGTVSALNPPAGLTAITLGGGASSQSATIQAQLNYIKTTWNGGRLLLPAGCDINLGTTGISIPERVSLVMDESTVLFYTGTGTAITINWGVDGGYSQTGFTPIIGGSLVGPSGSTGDTSIGVSITGVSLRVVRMRIWNFGRGVDVAHSNTWLISLIGVRIHNCQVCYYNDNIAASAGNAGEENVLDHCVLFNSAVGFRASGNGVHLAITKTSIDYCAVFGVILDAWVYLTDCHLESQGGTSGRYLFDVTGNSKVAFTNCDVIMGTGTTGTLNYLFKHTEGPSNYGNGQAHFANTKIYCAKPGGGDVTQWSEQLYEWPNDSTTTTMDIFTPFPLFWCPVSAHEVAQTFRNTSTTQATIGCSSPSGNLSFGDLRLTSTPGYKMIRVRFG